LNHPSQQFTITKKYILNIQLLDLVTGILKIAIQLKIGLLHRVDLGEIHSELFLQSDALGLGCLQLALNAAQL
jgi:hypothetical protein